MASSLSANDAAPKRRRILDTSNRQALLAVSDAVEQMSAWRTELVLISARAQKRLADAERQACLEKCEGIAKGLAAARTNIIIRLADADRKVKANSRVVDIERALDNLETNLNECRRYLLH